MRGQQALFSEQFFRKAQQESIRKSRNYHLPDRNKALVYRYYYHAEINRYRYDDCIAFLESEFYITQQRIITVLTSCNDMIQEVISKNPSVSELEKLYPHFSWKIQRPVR